MITAIILSAGESKRFGEIKQLYRIDNIPILERVIKCVSPVFPQVVLVLGFKAEEILSHVKIPKNVKIVINPHYENGMGISLAFGMNFVDPTSSHIAVFLSDMPYIEEETIKTLLSTLNSGKKEIVAPFYKGKRGFPVFFSRDFFGELKKLKGDKGARDLILKEKKFLNLINVGDEGVIHDIDTKEDI